MDQQSVLIWQSFSLYVLSIKCRTDLEAQSGVSKGELWYSPSIFSASASSPKRSTYSQEWLFHCQRNWLENKVVYYVSNAKGMDSYTNNFPFSYGPSSFLDVGLWIVQLCKSWAGVFFFVLHPWAQSVCYPFWLLAVNCFLIYSSLR